MQPALTLGLFIQLVVGAAMVFITVLLHLGGLALLIWLMRVHSERFTTRRPNLDQVLMLLGAALGLFALHSIEIWLYASLYLTIGAFGDLETALYFSTVTYSTLGYGDVLPVRAWRILGAIEAANGLILLGWTTAFFLSVISRMRALESGWFRGPGT